MSFFKHLLPAWKRPTEDKADVNTAILNAINGELTQTEIEAIESKIQSALHSATGEWLDQWGSWFGVYRKDGETDEVYRARMIEYVLLLRGTIPAILAAIRSFLQDYESHIEIYEPFNNIFFLNDSKLNGEDMLMGSYYRFAIIDIRMSRNFPLEILDVIDAFKPAGVKFYVSYQPGAFDPNASIVGLPLNGSIIHDTHTKLEIMNGLDDYLRTHIYLGLEAKHILPEYEKFVLNLSNLNSTDVLAGAPSISNVSLNYVGATNTDFSDNNMTLGNLKQDSTPITGDIFTRTTAMDDSGYSYNNTNKYLYAAVSVGAYMQLVHRDYVNRFSGNGVLTKDVLLKLIDEPKLSYSIRSFDSSSNYKAEIYNTRTKEWETLEDEPLASEHELRRFELSNVSDYLTDSLDTFVRFDFPVDIIIDIDYFELSFLKRIGSATTIKPVKYAVTTEQQLAVHNDIPDMSRTVNNSEVIYEINGNKPFRYIRDWIKGNDYDNNSYWREIKALNSKGENVARGKLVTSPYEPVQGDLQTITDGIVESMDSIENIDNMSSSDLGMPPQNVGLGSDYLPYVNMGSDQLQAVDLGTAYATQLDDEDREARYVVVDLGAVHYDICDIVVYHLDRIKLDNSTTGYVFISPTQPVKNTNGGYSPNLTYYGARTEVSIDGEEWFTLYDGAVDGLYLETDKGHTIEVPPYYEYGLPRNIKLSEVRAGDPTPFGVIADYTFADFEDDSITINPTREDYFNTVSTSIFYEDDVSINYYPNLYTNTITSEMQHQPFRYIRDTAYANITGGLSTWVEIQAHDTNGTNVALGKKVELPFTEQGGNPSLVTDGRIVDADVLTYFPENNEQSYVVVDLGEVYDNIRTVTVWHRFTEGRTYDITRTEVSIDGVVWHTLYDSTIDGKYKETVDGNVINVPSA